MELKINNQTKQFHLDSVIVQTLPDLEIPEKQNRIAITINAHVIPRTLYFKP